MYLDGIGDSDGGPSSVQELWLDQQDSKSGIERWVPHVKSRNSHICRSVGVTPYRAADAHVTGDSPTCAMQTYINDLMVLLLKQCSGMASCSREGWRTGK